MTGVHATHDTDSRSSTGQVAEQYDWESGKDAWKRYLQILEQADTPMQQMLHEFGEAQFSDGYAAGLRAALEALMELERDEFFIAGHLDHQRGTFTYVRRDEALTAIESLGGER